MRLAADGEHACVYVRMCALTRCPQGSLCVFVCMCVSLCVHMRAACVTCSHGHLPFLELARVVLTEVQYIVLKPISNCHYEQLLFIYFIEFRDCMSRLSERVKGRCVVPSSPYPLFPVGASQIERSFSCWHPSCRCCCCCFCSCGCSCLQLHFLF